NNLLNTPKTSNIRYIFYFFANSNAKPRMLRTDTLLHLVKFQNFWLVRYFVRRPDSVATMEKITSACIAKINPNIIIWIEILIPSLLMNCGKSAMKNKATLGLVTFIKKPFLISLFVFPASIATELMEFRSVRFSFAAAKAR